MELDSLDAIVSQPVGTYRVDAWVVENRSGPCPACKGPHPCAPCDPPRVSLSSQPPGEGGAVLHVDPAFRDLRGLASDRRYRFTLRVGGSAGDPRRHLELLGVTVPSAAPHAAPPPKAAAPDAAATAPPRAEPASCSDALPPAEMVADNMGATSVTAIGEIVASATAASGGSGAPQGYTNLRYDVRVVRWVRGSGPERIVVLQGVEAGTSPRPPGELLFFSACTSDDGSFYEPDVGYLFPAAPACRAELEALASAAAERAKPPPKKRGKKPSACRS